MRALVLINTAAPGREEMSMPSSMTFIERIPSPDSSPMSARSSTPVKMNGVLERAMVGFWPSDGVLMESLLLGGKTSGGVEGGSMSMPLLAPRRLQKPAALRVLTLA